MQTVQMELAANRENILGTYVNTLNMEMALAQLDHWVKERSRQYVCCTPAHSIMDGYNQPALQTIFNSSGMTVPDGMAVVWLLKLKGYRHVSRVYGPDLLMATCMVGCQKGYRHYFYGGDEGVTEKLVQKVSAQCPGIKVAGIHTPPFRPLTPKEDEQIVERLNQKEVDILWVGLGSPKQEVWMQEHRHRLKAPVMVGVGAAFDFLSGNKPQAPVWMQRNGLEWLFRFVNEPKRLWPRYRQYPKFLLLAALQLLGLHKAQTGMREKS